MQESQTKYLSQWIDKKDNASWMQNWFIIWKLINTGYTRKKMIISTDAGKCICWNSTAIYEKLITQSILKIENFLNSQKVTCENPTAYTILNGERGILLLLY